MPKGASGYWNLELAQKTNVLQQHYIKNKKSALRDLRSQLTCPEFPLSLWEAIIFNQYINFSKIHAIRIGNTADEEVVHQSGVFKFVVNQIEAKKTLSQPKDHGCQHMNAMQMQLSLHTHIEPKSLEGTANTCSNSLTPLASGDKGMSFNLTKHSE